MGTRGGRCPPDLRGRQTWQTNLLDDLGALNRWPERTSVPIERYLDLWTESCVAIGSTGELPSRLRQLFAIA